MGFIKLKTKVVASDAQSLQSLQFILNIKQYLLLHPYNLHQYAKPHDHLKGPEVVLLHMLNSHQ